MDSIICVAVITTLLPLRVLRISFFLDAGELGVAHFNAEVATRDHNNVRGFDNRVNICNRFGALYLGDDMPGAARRGKQVASFLYIRTGAYKRYGKKIHFQFDGQLDVFVGRSESMRPPTVRHLFLLMPL